MTVLSDISEIQLDYKSLLENMPDGFSYNRVIFDENSPSDFMILDVNNTFLLQIGLSKEMVVGRRFSEILPEFTVEKQTWIEAAYNIAANGGQKTFEFYSKILNKWFSMCIFSEQHQYFTVISRDITALKQEHERLRKLLDFSPDLIVVTDLKGNITDCNIKVLDTLEKHSKAEIVGYSVFNLISQEDRDSFKKHIKEALQIGYMNNKRYRFHNKDRNNFYCEISVSIIRDTQNNPINFIGIAKDITANVKAENAIRESEEKLRGIFASSPDAIYVLDIEGNINDCNNEGLSLLDFNSREEILGKNMYQFVVEAEHERLNQGKAALIRNGISKNSEYTVATKTKRILIVEGSFSIVYNANNEIVHVVLVCKDISERKRTENEIRFLSYHDKLTGLYNRAFFEEELNRLDTERQLPISLIIGDLNGLKLTNDIFGHNEGDRLLKTLSDILRKSCRREDIVARWGGDEFAIILPKTPHEAALKICERINSYCNEASINPLLPSIALGCATKDETDQSLQHILQEAENRMYRHKLLDNKSVHSSIITSLEKTLFERSYETEEHAQRMKCLAIKLGKSLGLSDTELDELSLLSLLHDIGKIAVPDSILMKPGKLDPQEWEEMKKHTEVGFRIAKSSKQLSHISDYILSHHERWDGKGYPRGLKGNHIPKLSRILTVIDSYDVMTHVRPYKAAISHSEAILEIEKCTGSQFDPMVSKAFIDLMNNVNK